MVLTVISGLSEIGRKTILYRWKSLCGIVFLMSTILEKYSENAKHEQFYYSVAQIALKMARMVIQ